MKGRLVWLQGQSLFCSDCGLDILYQGFVIEAMKNRPY